MMPSLTIDRQLETTKKQESVCLVLATAIHALLLLWNPNMLSSHYKPIHDFVTIDVVDQSAPGGYQEPEAPKKTGLMDTLKDMLMKPKTDDIAHTAPEPLAHRVAAPVQPALKEKSMPRAIANMFQPKSQTEDLAAQNAPSAIQTQTKNFNIPTGGPALQGKSFGGIRAKDLPFQVSSEQNISGGASVIPISVGDKSAKSALGYSNPTLQDSGKHRGITPSVSGGTGQLNSIGGGAPQTIEISGTGGTGNAPTGAQSGAVLQNRAGQSGGFGRGRGVGSGSGRGSGFGSGVGGIPSAAADLDAQLTSSAGGSGTTKSKKGFDIAGPLGNRPIMHKVIPQYPAWAEEQGIIGSVRIWFTVLTDGSVRNNMRVTKTTGYPDLDKLALDALKQWRFSAFNTADESSQWGIITFTFSLSS